MNMTKYLYPRADRVDIFPLRSLWMSSHGIVDRSSLLFAGGLLLLRALDARHVGQASLGTFGFAVPSISSAAWRF
jgi:hypothetical protein